MKMYRIVFALLLCVWCVPAHATDIEEVTSKGGIKAWLIEDHKLPLIALNFAFRGGVEQDPVDKQGVSTLTMSLLSQGAGTYDADTFQQQLADHTIMMRFEAGRDALSGNIKALREERQTAFDLLHLALTKPRFDPAEIERARNRQLTRLRFQMGDPDWQARYAMLHYVFENHPYSERSLGSVQTLAAITQTDIKAFASAHLARDNLLVAVAGDISPDELKETLDQLFGDLPAQAKLTPVPEVVWPAQTISILVPREGTQTALYFTEPGPKRGAPDWYATEIANYILGGGGFSSRLMQEVRDKNGLTYGIDTGLAPMEHAAMIVGNAATDNDKTAKAWKITQGVWSKFYHDGVKPDEITGAKDYLTGYLPLTMTSTDAIAELLIGLQIENLPRDYLQKRDGLIRGSTPHDIKAAIKKWFDPAMLSSVMVGAPQGITPTKTEPQVRE